MRSMCAFRWPTKPRRRRYDIVPVIDNGQIMKKAWLAVCLLALPLTVAGRDTPKHSDKATYVGGGHYACNSNSVDCATIKQNNRQIDRAERARHDQPARTTLPDNTVLYPKASDIPTPDYDMNRPSRY